MQKIGLLMDLFLLEFFKQFLKLKLKCQYIFTT